MKNTLIKRAVSSFVGSGCLLALATMSPLAAADDRPTQADVIVYEGSPAGVMAAVAAARHGHSVIIVEMNKHIGGMISGGLVGTDIGDRATVGGLADEFFKRVLKYYSDTYGPNSEQVIHSKGGIKFEPHVAEQIFDQMLAEQHVTVWKQLRINLQKIPDSVTRDANGNITAIKVEDLANGGTKTFTGKIFIDASYEGDLMAGAKVPYRVGREGRDEYGEYLAGVGIGPDRNKADSLVMTYNYRVNITNNINNRVLFPKPDHFVTDAEKTGAEERIESGEVTDFGQLFGQGHKDGGSWPNDKYDMNWCDIMGASNGYADGDWPTRERIAAVYKNFFLSRLYSLQNNPAFPKAYQDSVQKWGLSKDEFTDNGNFPFQLYVREARRMVGLSVLKEQDITQDRSKPDGVCAGSYGVDCHDMQALVINGKKVIEHTPHIVVCPYDIPYGVLAPPDKPGQPQNLLVPLCCSASHVAYCTLRMEPVYMMLGHAAGDAAHVALANQTSVQKVDTVQLRELLGKEGAILDAGYTPPIKITWSPEHPKVGEAVQFKAETGDLKDPLMNIWWDFDGDGKISAQGEQAQTTFKSDKIYSVSLVVEDKAGRRRMVMADVPVGQAVTRDITIDDMDALEIGETKDWERGYPQLVPKEPKPDVFMGPCIHYDVAKRGEKKSLGLVFTTKLPNAGRYEVCVCYRPAKKQATNVPVTITEEGVQTKVVLNEQAENPSPFPIVPVGEFKFSAGDDSSVVLTNDGADGTVVCDGVRWVWLGE